MTGTPYGDLLGDANAIFGADVEPLDGGRSGETFLVRLGGEEIVLRMYAHDPGRAEVDATLLRLLRGLVPVPELLEVRAPRDEMPVGLLLTSKLVGRRLDLVLAETDAADPLRDALGRSLGEVLGRLSCVPFLAPGRFVTTEEGARSSPGLRVEPMEPGPDDFVAWTEERLALEPLASWPVSLRSALSDLVRSAVDVVDEVTRVSLVHGDLDLANVLVDPVSGAVTGLVDWERAHAGLPVSDLGRLLRFEPAGAFASAATAAYGSIAAGVGDDLVDTARAADLLALIDQATQPTSRAVSRARGALSAFVRSVAPDNVL